MTKQSGIVRRPDFAGGGITDEEREKMAAHSAFWIKRAFRTDPADPTAVKEAVKGLYRTANLDEPRVILVPSPLVMAMAGGIASLWWYLFENNLLRKGRGLSAAAIRDATNDRIRVVTDAVDVSATSEMRDADTYAATFAATYAVTRDVTESATFAATYAATELTTRTATRDATYAVTDAETRDAILAAARDAVLAATDAAADAETYEDWLALAAGFVGWERAQAAIQAAHHWFKVCQGGNMWAPRDCYLTAVRDILGLRLPSHEVYAHWEKATTSGGFRWMHPRFCLVSDFPEVLRVNSRNQPHAEFGPSHRWRDGFAIWHLNGVRVEQWMAEGHPDDLEARRVLQVENVGQRRAQRRELIRRMGLERIIGQLQPTVLDVERREAGGEYRLLAVSKNHGGPWRFLQIVNQSSGAVHTKAVPRKCLTVRHALNWCRYQKINRNWSPIQLNLGDIGPKRRQPNPNQYQQGDVWIERVGAIPDGAERVDGVTLAEDECRHAHRFAVAADVELYVKDGVRYARVHRETTVEQVTADGRPGEHDPVTLPAGDYAFGQMADYDCMLLIEDCPVFGVHYRGKKRDDCKFCKPLGS